MTSYLEKINKPVSRIVFDHHYTYESGYYFGFTIYFADGTKDPGFTHAKYIVSFAQRMGVMQYVPNYVRHAATELPFDE